MLGGGERERERGRKSDREHKYVEIFVEKNKD